MKHKWIFILFALAIILVTSGTTVINAMPTASAGDVLIVEVGADPASSAGITEPDGEFFEIFNNTAAPISLNGWKVADNSGGDITLPNITLGPGKILVVIADEARLATPNGYGCSVNPLYYEPASWFSNNIHNDSDRLILSDDSANVIDAVSYGTDTTAFDPAASDIFNNSGTTLQRKTYNSNFTDTDTASDWAASTGSGSPCDVGPNAISLRSLSAAATPGAQAFVLPLLALLAAGGLVAWRRQ